MPVTQALMAAGSWSLRLKENTPRRVLDQFDIGTKGFGQIIILPNRPDATLTEAAQLRHRSAYVGIYRSRPDVFEVAGASPLILLGDEDGKGELLTVAISKTAGTLDQWLTDLLPSNGIAKGTVTNTGNNWTQDVPAYTSRRAVINDLMTATGAEFEVVTDASGNVEIDAAAQATLFGATTTPKALVLNRYAQTGDEGGRLNSAIINLLATRFVSAQDLEDWTEGIYVLARGDGGVTVGTATGSPLYYHQGTAIKMRRAIDAPEVKGANASSLATLQLARFQQTRRSLALSVESEDLIGKTSGPNIAGGLQLRPGDMIGVYDPLNGLVDNANPVQYRGEFVYPINVRCKAITWPISEGMGVYYVSGDAGATLTDLSDYFVPESGAANLEVGEFQRSAFTTGTVTATPYGDLPVSIASDAWVAYTPTWTATSVNPAIGNGTLTGKYRRIGRTIIGNLSMTSGSTTTFGTGDYLFTLPTTAVTGTLRIGSGDVRDASVAYYVCTCYVASSTQVSMVVHGGGAVGSTTIPWVNGDSLQLDFTYEAATS